MHLTIAYSKIKKRNLVLIINATYQRETLSERPIWQPLSILTAIYHTIYCTIVSYSVAKTWECQTSVKLRSVKLQQICIFACSNAGKWFSNSLIGGINPGIGNTGWLHSCNPNHATNFPISAGTDSHILNSIIQFRKFSPTKYKFNISSIVNAVLILKFHYISIWALPRGKIPSLLFYFVRY